MRIRSIVFIVLVANGFCYGAKLPPNYKRCDLKNSDIDECLVQALQAIVDDFTKAVPEIGLPTMDPLEINEMIIGSGSSAVDVNQEYRNVTVHGLQALKVTRLKFDFDAKIMDWVVVIPEAIMKFTYKLNGKVLLLPVVGAGPGVIILERLNSHMVAPFEIVQRKGKQYLNFINSKLTLAPEHVSYNFENLFNGDKALGDSINKVLNDNWKEIFDGVQVGFNGAYGAVLEGVANSVFGRVPLSEIFLNHS